MKIREVDSVRLTLALWHAGWTNSPEQIAALRYPQPKRWRLAIRLTRWVWGWL